MTYKYFILKTLEDNLFLGRFVKKEKAILNPRILCSPPKISTVAHLDHHHWSWNQRVQIEKRGKDPGAFQG